MNPTIGRVVHFTDYVGPYERQTRAFAAIVSDVLLGDRVALHVMKAGGVTVINCVDYSETPVVGKWSWPPRT